MQRDPSEALTAEVAEEVAVRDGIKAVIEGEVGSAGSGYILVATLRSADSGVALATFRRTAKGPDEVIDAIDGLSQDIREKAGESLRSIKAEAPLEAVTTTSLDALRKYSEAEALADQGEYRRDRTLLREAVAEDPDFAMAWRKLSVVIQTAGGEPGEGRRRPRRPTSSATTSRSASACRRPRTTTTSSPATCRRRSRPTRRFSRSGPTTPPP